MHIKSYPALVFGIVISSFMLACGTGQATGKMAKEVNYSAMSTLADALRTQSGVQVVGSANNIKVTVRGVRSSRSTTGDTYVAGGRGPVKRETTVLEDVEPLFVIDNAIVGNSYVDAARAVNVQDITSIKVLKSYSETNSYAEAGKNGVILIQTKLSADR